MTAAQTIRHPNGGALKAGLNVHVSQDTFADRESVIGDESEVFSSSLIRCKVHGLSRVFNSEGRNVIADGSTLAESRLETIYLRRAVLHRVTAASSRFGQDLTKVTPLTLVDVVAENCELYGNWSLEGNARIPTGVWHRAPRFLRITGEGVDFGLTESCGGYAMLGCFRKPLTELLHAGPRLGRKRGWSEEQIRAAKEFYEQLGDVPLEGVQP